MIHYHGTPITPKEVLKQMCPNNYCVSFWEPRDAEWCLANGQSVMFDNGAYSAYTSGKEITDWKPYYKWLEGKLYQPHWAVVPDKIGGTLDEQRELEKQWPFPRTLSAPVYHFGEDLDRIRELCNSWPRFAIGGSVGEHNPGSDGWRSIVDSIWNVIEKSNAYPMVHMMRAHSEASIGNWPFYSADSASWARHHAEHGPLKWDILHNINRKNPEIRDDKNLDLFMENR